MICQLDILGHGRVHCSTELLPKFECVSRAYLHTLGTCHALRLIHLCHIVGAYGISCTVHQPYAKPEAGTGTAVADSSAVTCFLYIWDIVHQTVFFGALNNFQSFLPRNGAGTPCADIVLSSLPHLDAHLFCEMAAPVIDTGTGGTAGTGRNAKRVIFVEIIAQLFKIICFGIIFNGTLHWDNAHQAIAIWEKRRHRFHTDTGILLKSTAYFRMGFQQFLIVHQHFHNAGSKNLHEIAVFLSHRINRPAEDTDPRQMLGKAIHFLEAFSGFLRQVGSCTFFAKPCSNRHIGFIVRHNARQAVVFRGVFIDLVYNTR